MKYLNILLKVALKKVTADLSFITTGRWCQTIYFYYYKIDITYKIYKNLNTLETYY